MVNSLEKYADYLKNEHFAWIVEVDKGEVKGNVLRLDLFRNLKAVIDSKKGELEFIGGIFHAFKHFSLNGRPLSTHQAKNDLDHPNCIFDIAIRGFFINEDKIVTKNSIKSSIKLDNKYILELVFYYEEKTDVYFLKTIIKKESRPS